MKFPCLIAIAAISSAQGFVVDPSSSARAIHRPQIATNPRHGSSSSTKLYGFFNAVFDNKAKQPATRQFEEVTIDPDFRVSVLFLALGGLLDIIPYIKWTLGLFTTLLGLLFFVQTFRIRFVFDEDNNLELKTIGTSNKAENAGENIVVGGQNKWPCDKIVNYDFFPQGWVDNPIGPVLVYFKETKTDSSKWNEGPGKSANDPDKIASGQAVAGQVHFFPAVCNGKQIRDEFAKRGCGKL